MAADCLSRTIPLYELLFATPPARRRSSSGSADSVHLRPAPAHGLQQLHRRHEIGRAYDMAQELAPHLGPARDVLDVGCGNGFIAMHLGALLGQPVHGVDVHEEPTAAIPYQRYDGHQLPFEDGSFDAVLLCYVLHHCSDPAGVVREVKRVLRPGGRIIVYEDTPETFFDRLACIQHELKWAPRTGRCSFLSLEAWKGLFGALELEVVHSEPLSRLRDPTNPLRRSLIVLQRS